MKSKNASRSTAAAASRPKLPPPSQEQIAALAYAIWLDRGQPCGCDVEHWLEAERQLRGVAEPLVDGNRLDPDLAPAARIDREMERVVSPPPQRSATSL